MALTPETLPRHELSGLPVVVVDATAPSRIGIAGRVVRETTNTLVVETDSGDRQLPKRGTTFEFALVDDPGAVPPGDPEERLAAGPASDAGHATRHDGTANEREGERSTAATDPLPTDAERVVVEGEVLVERPARRTENGVEATWH